MLESNFIKGVGIKLGQVNDERTIMFEFDASFCEGVKVDAHVEQITLSELTEGTYKICVMAHTAVGGATGPCQMVLVGKNEAIWINFFFQHSCPYKHSVIFKPVCVSPQGLMMFK